MRDVDVISQGVVCRDEFLYSSHPHAARAKDGGVLVVFNQTRRRPFILHPPHDPLYRNVIARSTDGGASWSTPQVVPNYDFHGTECASLTTLRDGNVLLNQWRFRWYPLGLARSHPPPEETLHFPEAFVRELVESGELPTGKEIAVSPEGFAPWARGHGQAWVHASCDGGLSFTRSVMIDTGPFHGGYGMRGMIELPNGELLLPLNDIPEYQTIYTARSSDGGVSWRDPHLVAAEAGHLFTEAALALAPSGDILGMMRDDASRTMHVCRSRDGGWTWSPPLPTGIDGYPPHLLVLRDGRLLCTYGVRQPEYSIRAVLSADDGRTWETREPLRIRGELTRPDLGYPATIALDGQTLLSVYYCQDEHGVTGIEFTRWQI